jgi:hypothetical protein
MDVSNSSRDDYLHVALAPSYGKLTSENVKQLDDELKVMISGVIRAISAIPPEQRTWEKVQSSLMESPIMEPGEDAISRADRLLKEGTNVFRIDGSPDHAIVKEV